MDRPLPALRHITPAQLAELAAPSSKIQSDDDVQAWKTTRGYADYALFLRRLTRSVVGQSFPAADLGIEPPIAQLLELLDKVDNWIDEIPPLQTPQRFGNLAFRTWGRRLEEECDNLLRCILPTNLDSALPHLRPYFITSFGSFSRMDYGTGHETSFAIFLFCLTTLRIVEPNPDVERMLVMNVFLRYLQVCWRLQDVYQLEPAGSHGVWGLDDSCFLPYIFGSGQLLNQTNIAVDAVLKEPLPDSNLYFMAISRIRKVKTGPFHEHSSQLYSIAVGVKNWGKVNSGLFKMYEAEVLGKRVVVQHIPLGGLVEWDLPESEHVQDLPSTTVPWAPITPHTVGMIATTSAHPAHATSAPWATPATAAPLAGQTSAPWTSSAKQLPAVTPPGW
ncbi:Phosphotyrosyl phosphatase activator [Cylindrobasidium torrendii FP15055 ss-10]|uniref:Serine/threonine-protein phosphatase 2A activator n=1 Tax=Cylindrobasidium torrendii FP15055 ss-10 TaxID=1314674 RepID=A0A0D7AVA6_9AGAR|nr:Phosphotyrosyl phosphatase activator [Cylindrobasidium torrendii FP15055 ss-10]